MFGKIKTTSLKYKTANLPSQPNSIYNLPALTAGIQNQGLNNYVPRDGATILKDVISISANGANTGVTFYQSEEFTVLQDAYAIKWIGDARILSGHQYLFFVSAILRSIYGHFEWTNKAGWERIKGEKISLPTKDGAIDFDFMEGFIAELEAQRIAELEAYLSVTGLKDYHLTEEENAALNRLEKVELGEYRIGDLFEINSTNSFNTDVLVDGNEYDYVTRTSLNQGILRSTGFVNADNINPAGNWSLGLLQMDFFYRKKPWYAGQFVRKVTPKIELSENAILFFSVLLNKLKLLLLNVLVRNVDDTFTNAKISLPTKDGAIDFDFMEVLIRAIQKLVIRDVVEFADSKITATKQICR